MTILFKGIFKKNIFGNNKLQNTFNEIICNVCFKKYFVYKNLCKEIIYKNNFYKKQFMQEIIFKLKNNLFLKSNRKFLMVLYEVFYPSQ